MSSVQDYKSISSGDIRDSLEEVICEGESFFIGTNEYSVSGIYQDTLVPLQGL